MKAMKYMMASLVVAIFFVMLLLGCKKEQDNNNTAETNVSTGMLYFKSAEEFAETQQKVLAMSETERREWERQQGFKSYATKCEELFGEFEAKGINSDEDIYNFVKENSDYFYIREEEGEKYLASYLECSSYYQFVDENSILQIGENLIKVFDEGVIIAPIDQKERLSKVNSFYESAHESFLCLESQLSESFIESYLSYFESRDNEDGCNCGRQETIVRKTNDNGYERTYVRFYIQNGAIATGDSGYDSFLYGQGLRRVSYHMKVRPYRKNFGIWFWCRRTISYNVDYTIYDNYRCRTVSDNRQGQDIGGKIDIVLYSFEGFPNVEFFESLTGYASTPNASCIITCSTID